MIMVAMRLGVDCSDSDSPHSGSCGKISRQMDSGRIQLPVILCTPVMLMIRDM